MKHVIKTDARGFWRTFAALGAMALLLVLGIGNVHAQDKAQAGVLRAPPPKPSVWLTITPASSPSYAAPATIDVAVDTLDPNDFMVDAELYKDNVLVASGQDSIRVTLSNLSAGTYSFKAIANNEAGGTATKTQTVTITAPVNQPPTVSLTSPTNGQTFTAGQAVTLSATASDSDGTVARVEFYVDGGKVGESTAAPYSVGWTGTTGSHSVYARAVDNAGAATNSGTATITVNAPANVPPTVSLTSPTNGQAFTAGQMVALAATAADSDGSVARVEFYIDGGKVGESTTAPYSVGWGSTTGSHGIYARAVDNAGAATNSGTATITVNAANNVPPTVSLTSPTNGQTFTAGQVVTLAATAADSDGSVARVEFLVDGNKVGESTTAPYSFSWTGTTGSHSIYARAVDNAGAATTSATATITVNAANNVPPTVSLTSPTNGQTFTAGQAVTLSATAADSDGTVARVEFYIDGGKVGESTAAPYSFNWTGTAGTHGVYAQAVDNGGAVTASATASITVNSSTQPPSSEIPTPTPLTPVSGGASKTELITYSDNTATWVLGQVATVTDVGTGLVQSATTYDAVTALPLTTSAFGKLQSSFSYNADGTLATVKDGRNNTTTLSNWKRGIPQSMQYADGTTQSAVVNDAGWITSITDENGYLTAYTYDAMGRVSGITYPTGDSVAWTATTRSFVAVASAEYGLPAGHWRLTESTGNAVKVTYYDGMWRPVLAREYDAANMGATERFVRTAYDAEGRPIFTSYPSTGFYPANTDTSVKPHDGAGGVSCSRESVIARSSSARRSV